MKDILRSRPLMWSALVLIGMISLISASRYRRIKNIVTDEWSDVFVSGKVADVSNAYGKTQIVLKDLTFQGSSADEISQIIKEYEIPILMRSKAVVSTDATTDFKVGQRLTVCGVVSLFPHATNPGEFDTRKYNLSRAKVIKVVSNDIVMTDDQYSQFAEKTRKIRESLSSVLTKYLSDEDAGIMIAMLLGDRSRLGDDDRNLFREGGILHIISISGMHISFLGGLTETLIKLLPLQVLYRGYSVKEGRLISKGGKHKMFDIVNKVTLAVPLVVITLFVCMLPYSPSSVRAAVMFGLGQSAKMLGRASDIATNMALAALVTLIFNPYACLDSGFLLTYFAVIGIAVIAPTFHSFRKGYTNTGEKLFGGIPITLSTFPVIMNSYYEVPILAPLANPIMIPAASVLLGLGLLLAISGDRLDFISRIAAFGISSILFLMRLICNLFSLIPFNMVVTGHRPPGRVILFYTILYGASLYMLSMKRQAWLRDKKLLNYSRRHNGADVSAISQREKKKLRRQSIIYSLLLVLDTALLFAPMKKEDKVIFLDVGQGDCAVIETCGNMIIVDGGSSSRTSVGTKVIAPYMKYEGRKYADSWILTHPDNDHINGFIKLIGEGEPTAKKIYLPLKLSDAFSDKCEGLLQQCDVVYLDQGDDFDNGTVRLSVVSPSVSKNYGDDNAASLCFVLDCNEKYRFIFMADAGNEAETEVLNFIDGAREMTVLKVAHHGSAIGTNSDCFIRGVSPDIAVISCGKDNRYGHPHEETLKILKDIDADIYRTDQCGHITVKFDAK